MLLFPLISQQNFVHIFSTLTKLPVSYISITFLTRVWQQLDIISMCAVSPMVHTSNVSSCQKKTFFTFPVAVDNSIKVSCYKCL